MWKGGLRASTALIGWLLCCVSPGLVLAAEPSHSAEVAELAELGEPTETTSDSGLIPGYADTPALAARFSAPTAADDASATTPALELSQPMRTDGPVRSDDSGGSAAPTADLRVFGTVAAKVGLQVSLGPAGTSAARAPAATLATNDAGPVNVRMTTSALDGRVQATARFATAGKPIAAPDVARRTMLPASVDAAYDVFRTRARVLGQPLDVTGQVRQELTLAPDAAGQLRFEAAGSRNEVTIGGSFAGVAFDVRHVWSTRGDAQASAELTGPTQAVTTVLQLPLRTLTLTGVDLTPTLRYSTTMAHSRPSDGHGEVAATVNTVGVELRSQRWSLAWSSAFRDIELGGGSVAPHTRTRREDLVRMGLNASTALRVDLVARRAETSEHATDYVLNEARLDLAWTGPSLARIRASVGASTWNDSGSGRAEQRATMTAKVELPLRLWPRRSDAPVGTLTFSQGLELIGSGHGSQGSPSEVGTWHVQVGVEIPLP